MIDYKSDKNECKGLAYVMARRPQAVKCSASSVGKPPRERHHARSRTHGLRPSVYGPQRRIHSESGREPEREIYQGRHEQSRRKKTADIASVRQKPVGKLSHGIGHEQSGSDYSELRLGKNARIDYRFLYYVDTQPADIIQPVSQRRGYEHRRTLAAVRLSYLLGADNRLRGRSRRKEFQNIHKPPR